MTPESLPTSWSTAKQKKAVHYFTGRPCVHGHVSKRYASTGQCYECMRLLSSSVEKKKYDKKYNKDNRPRVARRLRIYYLANRTRCLETVKLWRHKYPEKRATIAKSYKARRRAQTRDADATSVIHEWESKQPKVCYWCGGDCANTYHMDHYYPLSRGGKHAVENLVIACPSCNHREGAKEPEEFARELARHIVNPSMLA